MTGYEASIREASKQLTAKERIAIKDTSNCIQLDEATKAGKIVFSPDYYAIISIHNEKSDDKEYEKYVVVAKDGQKYCTGSRSFLDAFIGIFDEMLEEDEAYEIEVYRVPSKNYKGKEFLTCSIV